MKQKTVGLGLTRHHRLWKRAAFIFAVWGAVLVSAHGAQAATLTPTDDVAENFDADPRPSGHWRVVGTWDWDADQGAMVSSAARSGSLLWTPGRSYTGTFLTRVNLISGSLGKQPTARVVFARDSRTGAFRYVQITAGNPGRIIVGQVGTIRGSSGRTIHTLKTAIPAGQWLELGVRLGGDSRVTVTLGPTTLFTTTVAPLALGQIGVATRSSKVMFDLFSFTADPDQEPCQDCHAGAQRPARAADIYTYWDGTWWDATQTGSPSIQQGGHGDPGGKPAVGCTGAAGCHDQRLPQVSQHRNGVHEPGSSNLSVNPWHLRSGFISATPSQDWDVQVTFDNFCFTACHQGLGVANMRHQGAGAERSYLQLGYGLTEPTGKGIPADMPLDNDLTSAARSGVPVFAPCITCHDPHGTGTIDNGQTDTPVTNHMLRRRWKNKFQLCVFCHI